jgi:hypothetical protein
MSRALVRIVLSQALAIGLSLTVVDGAWGQFGACCLPDGGCSETTSTLCTNFASGSFQGAGSSCTPDPCGACCPPSCACFNTGSAICAAGGGTFLGTASSCADEFVCNDLACDDEDACTIGDACVAASCIGPTPLACLDFNPCTDDLCDSEVGCIFSPNTDPCDDGVACTVGDVCASGICTSGSPVNCPSGFVGGCPAPFDHLWSCFDNWNLPGEIYPDNAMFAGPFDVVLDDNDEVLLDVDVTITSLTMQPDAVLRITLEDGPGPSGGADLIVQGTASVQSSILVAGDNMITAGQVTIAPGGSYAPDPDSPEPGSATLSAQAITIVEGPPGSPGSMNLEGGMSFSTQGDFTLVGIDDNCTPPILRVQDAASAAVGGDFIMQGAADILYASSIPMQLQGDFVNQSASGEIFDWPGGIVLGPLQESAGAPQLFEAGGRDWGSSQNGYADNFALGSLEVLPGVNVTLADSFDNDGLGQAACEALYVGSLTLGAGATVVLDDARIYYHDLNDPGATIQPTGCGALLRIAVSAGDVEFCADQNGDGVRDSNCMWWTVSGSNCSGTPIVFGDMGGFNGACPPDGTADLNDRFHALNCFSNVNVSGSPPYPCEANPPAALNVDAGGSFGDCSPDGVCDGNDAFHALDAFDGSTLCSCPADGGPSPDAPSAPGRRVSAAVALRSPTRHIRGGDRVQVEVRLASAVADLRGYQLHLGVRGGARGELALVDAAVHEAKDHVFAGLGAWQAFNRQAGQLVSGVDSPGSAAPGGAYLATFTYQASPDAEGEFAVELLHGAPINENRSFLFATHSAQRIDILPVQPLKFQITPMNERRRR